MSRQLLSALFFSIAVVTLLMFLFNLIRDPALFPVYWNDIVDLVVLVFRVTGGFAIVVFGLGINFLLRLLSIGLNLLFSIEPLQIDVGGLLELYDLLLERMRDTLYLDVES